jgi:hypothetical protein
MKRTISLLLGLSLVGMFLLLNAADPGGASQVVLGFAGGSQWTSQSTGICVGPSPMLGVNDWRSLFDVSPPFGTPDAAKVGKETAYLIWVSDFSVQMLPSTPPHQKPPADPSPYQLAFAPAGTATIYYSPTPARRDWSDLTKRSTWGEPVATFTRNASIVRSPDSFASDTFVFSADLVSSKPFTLNGKIFDFKSLIPRGMTCFEHGQLGTSWESGTCVAVGGGQ